MPFKANLFYCRRRKRFRAEVQVRYHRDIGTTQNRREQLENREEEERIDVGDEADHVDDLDANTLSADEQTEDNFLKKFLKNFLKNYFFKNFFKKLFKIYFKKF